MVSPSRSGCPCASPTAQYALLELIGETPQEFHFFTVVQ